MDAIGKMPDSISETKRATDELWVRNLVAGRDVPPDYLAPHAGNPRRSLAGCWRRFPLSVKTANRSWACSGCRLQPQGACPNGHRCGFQGKAGGGAVRIWCNLCLTSGMAVLAVDLRGRGETLGHMGPDWDTNFRLVANQVEFGQALPGRRAFDLLRTVDYLNSRQDLASEGLAVVGLGDDALPALLAAAVDTRIQSVVMSGYFHSFISQMRPMTPPGNDPAPGWNDAQLKGILKTPEYEIDLGSVIPSALLTVDVPDLVALLAPRKVLFCQARDAGVQGTEALVARFRQVTAVGGNWLRYAPAQSLDGQTLRGWLRNGGGQ